jgi:AraC family transcriptional regulator
MPELKVDRLLVTELVSVRHVQCAGTHRHRGAEECASATHLVFPYRGVYTRHVGGEQAIADANHVLFFNATEGYQVAHPIAGGDRSLVVMPSEEFLRELAPAPMLISSGTLRLREQHRRIDPQAQSLVALLRHQLTNAALEGLAAETHLLTLISHSLGPRTSHELRGTRARRSLVDRVKLLLLSDLARRWTLAEIGAEMGASPVYLTQLFRQVEGVPLYRYHLRLRLARALDLVPHHEDLATLAHDLGFSSHAHFTSAFRQAYGQTPSEFQRSIGH